VTYTYAILEVSGPAYDEIRKKLEEAGYNHAFDEDGNIDMRGIALSKEPDGEHQRKPGSIPRGGK
jgi:hypothetical protein